MLFRQAKMASQTVPVIPHALGVKPITLDLPISKQDSPSAASPHTDIYTNQGMSRHSVLAIPGPVIAQGTYIGSESPTTSPFRARWSEIREWTLLPFAVTQYINSLSRWELDAIVDDGNYMGRTLPRFLGNLRPASRENQLYAPFLQIYKGPHELVVLPERAAQGHALIDVPAPETPLIGDPDYLFFYNDLPVGIIELKTFRKVTAQAIDEVLNGNYSRRIY
jgi:hypothetical protein